MNFCKCLLALSFSFGLAIMAGYRIEQFDSDIGVVDACGFQSLFPAPEGLYGIHLLHELGVASFDGSDVEGFALKMIPPNPINNTFLLCREFSLYSHHDENSE